MTADTPAPSGVRDGKMFSLGAILTVTDGRLVAPGGIGDLYEIVNFLTGDNISTIGLLAAHEPCKAALLAQHPLLASVDREEVVNADNWRAWLTKQEARCGAALLVVPMEHWDPRSVADDVLDAMRLAPNAEILVVEP